MINETATIYIKQASETVLDLAENISVASGTDSDVFLDTETAEERLVFIDCETDEGKEITKIIAKARSLNAEYIHLF